eukprot:scaffold1023_cov313-Pinguiococcus_pyrenoidosus.AAC.20
MATYLVPSEFATVSFWSSWFFGPQPLLRVNCASAPTSQAPYASRPAGTPDLHSARGGGF